MARNLHFILSIILLMMISGLLCIKQFSVKGRKIVDRSGRQRYFHGTNVVKKRSPFLPITTHFDRNQSFNEDDIAILKQNGFNSIRLGVMWGGVQPKKDQYNQTYLEQVMKVINKSGQAGIYTVINFQQDVFSQAFCGNGVPIWIVDQIGLYKTFPWPLTKHKFPRDAKGYPEGCFSLKKDFAIYYFSHDMSTGFDMLYNTNTYLFDKFAKFWQKIASYFKQNPYVIAYEFINEPWIGSIYKNPLLIVPSVAQRLKLQNFYDVLAWRIKEFDQNTPLCFEPVTFDNTVPTGFTHPPGGKKFENMSIFCYHHYQPPQLSLSAAIDRNLKNAQKLNIPTLITETFGYDRVLNKLESVKQGLGQNWIYWQYKEYSCDNVKSEEQKLLSHSKGPSLYDLLQQEDPIIKKFHVRTYMLAVAGKVISQIYNLTANHYFGEYWPNSVNESSQLSQRQTIIYINSQNRSISQHFDIQVSPKADVQIVNLAEESGKDVDKNYFKLIHKASLKQKISIRITQL